MKKIIYVCFLALAIFCLGGKTEAATSIKIDVLYMNHGPLLDTLNKMKGIFSTYGDKIIVSWHEFDTEEGEQFKAKMGIRQHIPLVIWIDGQPKWTVAGKPIAFTGFPTGSGPAFFQGQWTMEDLKAALNLATGKK